MIRSSLRTYLLAGKLLHIITLIELVAGYFIIKGILQIETDSWFLELCRIYGVIYFASLPVFAQLDARSRYQNYKQVKDQFIMYGFDRRILKPIIKSRCQRDAAMLAAEDTGHKYLCQKIFREAGYRWYHLFPDFVFTHPQFLFTGHFWKSTFFCPYYEPKFLPGKSESNLMGKNQNFILIND
jgi:hypothetical protein